MARKRFTAGLILCAISGCATEDIVVSEVALTDRPDASVVGWTANERGREVFSPEDEEVTIKVLFNFNYRGVYEWFKVEWIAPGGVDYQAVLRRTEFASHRDFKASLKIRGKMASRLPGLWRVRVSLRGRDGAPDRELVSRMFRIAEPTAKMIAAGLTPVDLPDREQGRPLASYSRTEPPKPKQPGDKLASTPPSTFAPDDAQQPAVLPAPALAPEPAAPAPDQELRVLAPVAIAGASAAVAVAAVTKPKSGVMPSRAESAVSLRSTAADPGKPLIPPRDRRLAGCPPLYYPPGPGCVEQAPEE